MKKIFFLLFVAQILLGQNIEYKFGEVREIIISNKSKNLFVFPELMDVPQYNHKKDGGLSIERGSNLKEFFVNFKMGRKMEQSNDNKQF